VHALPALAAQLVVDGRSRQSGAKRLLPGEYTRLRSQYFGECRWGG
jgi:hypothetical protein